MGYENRAVYQLVFVENNSNQLGSSGGFVLSEKSEINMFMRMLRIGHMVSEKFII